MSLAIKCTTQYIKLLPVKLHIRGKEVEAVPGNGATALVVGKCQLRKFGIGKRLSKDKVRQGDRSIVEKSFVPNVICQRVDSFLGLDKLAMDTAVWDIRNGDIMLGLSWLTNKGFLVQGQESCLKYVNTG